MSGKYSRSNSKEFYEFDTTDETDRSLELEEEEADDVYEMALEVLEADEAFRLQSSGSVSPECDVDRMLENADTERFSGDVTLVRIFSIRQDSEIDLRGSKHSKGVPNSHEAFDPVESGEWGTRNSLGEGWGGLRVVSSKGVPTSHEAFDPRSAVENGEWGTRNSLGEGGDGLGVVSSGGVGTTSVRAASSEPCVHRALLVCGAEFASLDSQHSESEVFADPDFTKTPSPVMTDFSNGGEELLCVARFSNVQSKDAKIRTALTSRSPHGIETEAGSDVSLHVTSSDSLYSAPDGCFDDSAVVDPTYCGTSNVNNTSDTLYTNTNGDDERFYDRFPAFGFREPSPEDLFDEALETRSDLASSIGSSSVHPRVPYFDAVCAHRGRTPEDEFDLALETTLHRNQPTAPTPDTLLTGLTDADNVRSDMSKVAEYDSSIGADIRRLGHCVSPAESLGTSRDVVADETTSHFGHPAAAANAGQCPLSFTVDEDAKPGDRCYAYLEPWSSDCPSSPEPSYLAECSTDDCIGESEGDESFTDYEAPSKTDFFHRLLSRKEQFDAAGDLWNKESRFDGKGEEEEESLDNIRICSIEDLLTDDSENERYFGEVVAPSLDQRPPAVFPRVRAKGPGFVGDGPRRIPAAGEGDEEAPNTVALSPPIALAVRADIQFARKSKIPKLPESRGDLSPVRISW